MKIDELFGACRYSNTPQPLTAHFHNSFELIFVKAGTATLTIGAKSYPLHAGMLAFLSNFEEHSVTGMSENYERYYATIAPAAIDRYISDARLILIFRNRPADFVHTLDVQAHMASIEENFRALLDEYERRDECSLAMAVCSLIRILVTAYRIAPERFPAPDSAIETIVCSVQAYIAKNFMHNIQIARLAEEHFISIYYLSHAFREVTGYSPKQYLLLSRIAHAKTLLLGTNLPVSAVAVKCGFGDVNNFIRAFKKECGITPLKYKERSSG